MGSSQRRSDVIRGGDAVQGQNSTERRIIRGRSAVCSTLKGDHAEAMQLHLPYLEGLFTEFKPLDIADHEERERYVELQRGRVRTALSPIEPYKRRVSGDAEKNADIDPKSTLLLKIVRRMSRKDADWEDIGNGLQRMIMLMAGMEGTEVIREKISDLSVSMLSSGRKAAKLKALYEEVQNLHKIRHIGNLEGEGNEVALDEQPEDTSISKKEKNMIKRFGALVERGKMDEAMRLYAEMRKAFHDYSKVWKEGAHSFMKEKFEPDQVVSMILRRMWLNEDLRKYFFTRNRMIEFGPGVGNDATCLVRGLPNIAEYHAVEGYEPAAKTTKRRLKRLQREKDFGYRVDNADFQKKMRQWAQNDKRKVEKGESTIIFSKSTLHYDLEQVFSGQILPDILSIAERENGLLILALKTPDSATWKEHEPIYDPVLSEGQQDGYLCGIHRKEKQLRAFITKDKLNRLLVQSGFKVINIEEVTIPGYDKEGQDEVFTLVFAEPSKKKSNK